jgi:hypothetical protein
MVDAERLLTRQAELQAEAAVVRADLGLDVRSPDGPAWKADIWFVDEPDRQPDLAHMREIPPRLTTVVRAAILVIKEAWAGRPEYGRTVTSWDVYRAVLDHDVRSVAEFGEWVTGRGAGN